MSLDHEDWFKAAQHHHHEANRHADNGKREDPRQSVGFGIIGAILALVNVQFGIYLETRKIRELFDRRYSNAAASLGLAVKLIAKDGGNTMPGTYNPTEAQDALLQLTPVNASGQPTTGPFTYVSSDPAAGTLTPAADSKSATFVTAPGAINTTITVTDSVSGLSDTATIARTGGQADNSSTSLGLTVSLVDKGGSPPPAGGAASFAGATVNDHGQLVSRSGALIASAYAADPSKFVDGMGRLIDVTGKVIRQKA